MKKSLEIIVPNILAFIVTTWINSYVFTDSPSIFDPVTFRIFGQSTQVYPLSNPLIWIFLFIFFFPLIVLLLVSIFRKQYVKFIIGGIAAAYGIFLVYLFLLFLSQYRFLGH